MKKIATIVTVLGLMLVGAPVASACSDLGFSNAIMKSSNQAQRALSTAQRLDFSAGYTQIRAAKRTYNSAPAPCGSSLRTVNYQFGKALNAYENGMLYAMSGSYSAAAAAFRNGLMWTSRATDTMQRLNSR